MTAMPVIRSLTMTMLLLGSNIAIALEGARPAYIPPPVVDTTSMVKITLSLLLILFAIMAIAWLFKRLNLAQQGRGDLFRVIGSVAIGQRERVVLLEVGDTWLLVGVGPGQIRTLHTLDKMTDNPSAPLPASDNKFGTLLSSMLKHRHADRKNDAS